MSDELTPKEEKALEELSKAVASELVKGKSKEKIVKKLVKQDWAQDTAVQFVDNIEKAINEYKNSPEGRNLIASKYAKHMLSGILWAVGGTIVTAVTYKSASGGGTYIVALGAIVFGIIDFFRGLFGWLQYKT